MERIRQAIDSVLFGVNDVLYGWRLGLTDTLGAGSALPGTLVLVAAAITIAVLARQVRAARRRAAILAEVAEGTAGAPTEEAATELLFRALFRTAPVPAACVYATPTAEGPLVLQARQANPAFPATARPDWDPAPSLTTVPAEPVLEREGTMFVCSLPVTIEGRPRGLVRLASATEAEGRRSLAAAPFLGTLLAAPLARMVTLERVRRLQERAAEATVVSGTSRTLLGTALEPEDLASLLLDLMLRATAAEAGAVVGGSGRVLACRAPHPQVASLVTAALMARPWPAADTPVDLVASRGEADVPLRTAGFGALLEAPLVVDAAPAGAIVLLRRTGAFGDNHRRIVRLNAARLALSLRNRRFHEAVFGEYKDTLRAVVTTFEAAGGYLEHHSLRVARLAVHLAGTLGLPEPETAGVHLAGELHDVGMTGLGDDILLKSGRLSTQEYDLVRHHPVIGAAMTAPIHRPVAIAPLVMHHHERWDGQGYPVGLREDEIPQGARILALGEVFDAMLTARSYRAALSFEEALARLRSLAGSQLDPRVVESLLDTMTLDRWRAMARQPE